MSKYEFFALDFAGLPILNFQFFGKIPFKFSPLGAGCYARARLAKKVHKNIFLFYLKCELLFQML
jgi:hypothetical protein